MTAPNLRLSSNLRLSGLTWALGEGDFEEVSENMELQQVEILLQKE